MTSTPDRPAPPMAERRPYETTIHGETLVDEYHWLRQRDNPEVIAYLTAENVYTTAALSHTAAVQQTLYAEMRGRIQETDQTAPQADGDYWYYTRTEAGRQYPVYCRAASKPEDPPAGTPAGMEEILLDVNTLAEGHDYTAVGAFVVSPDHRLLAYTVDHAGNERYTLCFKDLTTGELLTDQIRDVYYGLVWANDNATVFYNVVDHATRPHKLFRHRLGSKPADDELVFHEEDERFFLSVRRSKSGRYLFIHLGSNTTDEEWFLEADAPDTAPQLIQARRQGVEYQVDHHRASAGDDFYILTNDEAEDFRVMRTAAATPARDHWTEVIPHRPGEKLDSIELFAHHLVLYLRSDGLRRIRIYDLRAGNPWQGEGVHAIDFPEEVYTVIRQANPVYDGTTLRFVYSSLTTPPAVFDYDMATRARELQKEEPVPGYQPDEYTTRRIWATAADGVKIPVSLVHRKDVTLRPDTPCLLYGYGAYGACIDPGFRRNVISLLDRGFSFAIAHIRGGGEMGRAWYEDGKLLRKRNTFTDFIAAAEHLIAQGYTSPEQLAAMGRSAGGLLMGAVATMRSDLFRAVVAGVPFVDVINTMLDPTLPLTVIEWEEWGNPAIAEEYAYMKAYSPYDNVTAQAYPNLLATAGLNDPRVAYWEPAKWVAKLRTHKTGANLLLLKTNMGAGHGGASGRFDYLEEVALEYAFILECIP